MGVGVHTDIIAVLLVTCTPLLVANKRTYRVAVNLSTDLLDAYSFDNLNQVRELYETWVADYNNHRPHDSLGGLPPRVYRKKMDSSTGLLCFAVNKLSAQQQGKDSLSGYMKQFRMYKLTGIPDSAFNIQHWDSTKL